MTKIRKDIPKDDQIKFWQDKYWEWKNRAINAEEQVEAFMEEKGENILTVCLTDETIASLGDQIAESLEKNTVNLSKDSIDHLAIEIEHAINDAYNKRSAAIL